jgi:hypothetical protein
MMRKDSSLPSLSVDIKSLLWSVLENVYNIVISKDGGWKLIYSVGSSIYKENESCDRQRTSVARRWVLQSLRTARGGLSRPATTMPVRNSPT